MPFLPFYNSVPKGLIINFNAVQLNGSYVLLATNLCNFASGKFLLNKVSWEFVSWWLISIFNFQENFSRFFPLTAVGYTAVAISTRGCLKRSFWGIPFNRDRASTDYSHWSQKKARSSIYCLKRDAKVFATKSRNRSDIFFASFWMRRLSRYHLCDSSLNLQETLKFCSAGLKHNSTGHSLVAGHCFTLWKVSLPSIWLFLGLRLVFSRIDSCT